MTDFKFGSSFSSKYNFRPETLKWSIIQIKGAVHCCAALSAPPPGGLAYCKRNGDKLVLKELRMSS